MKKALIALGTNIGDRALNINNALEALSLVPGVSVLKASSLYETEPWGFTEQRSFYNAVAEVETELTPHALLGVCLGIEAGMGRVREFKNGPRIIDLDLLLYDGASFDEPQLRLPHPGIAQRDFVIAPLKELYPCLCPYGFDYSACKDTVDCSSVVKIEKRVCGTFYI